MNWLKILFTDQEYKVKTKEHVIKGRLLTIYLHNGEKFEEIIKDGFYTDSFGYKHYNSMCGEIVNSRLYYGDSISIDQNGINIVIPKTSVLKSEIGLEQSFETIEVYSHLE